MNPDGTVTIYLQSTSPGPDKEANWLPTASVPGRFAILARSYAPGREFIEASFDLKAWNPGAIVRVEGTAEGDPGDSPLRGLERETGN